MKKRLLCTALLLCLLCTVFLLPQQPVQAASGTENFTIVDYHVDLTVSKDRVYKIEESMLLNFHRAGRGIYRDINLKSDASIYTISDISVRGMPYEIEQISSNVCSLKIGDPSKYVTGEVRIVISYTLTEVPLHATADMVRLNLIGTEWKTDIYNASFTAKYADAIWPKSFQSYVGRYGSTNTDAVSYTTNEAQRRIDGKVKGALLPCEGVTFESVFAPGTLTVKADSNVLPALLVTGASFGLFFLLRLIAGHKEEIMPIVEFYAPFGYSPLEIGYLIDRSVDKEDLGSMIIYWASHNHLHIQEDEDGNYDLILMEPLDDKHPAYEHTAFAALFKLGENGQVAQSELEYNYYADAKKMGDVAKKDLNRKVKMRTTKSTILQLFIHIISIACVSFAFGLSLKGSYIAGVGCGCIATLIFWRLHAYFYSTKLKSSNTSYLIKSILSAAGNALFLVVLALMLLPLVRWYTILLLVTSATLNLLAHYFDYHSKEYLDVMNHVIGFRNFIETAEKERIEALVEDNPAYFYDVLPYAMVLGITNLWGEKFEGIALTPPDWYNTTQAGDVYTSAYWLMRMNTLNRSMTRSMLAQPVSDSSSSGGGRFSGGGFSGGSGGFSGGGGGGGGGGGW